jgi:dihydroflavonol-4-reductase
VRVLITGANGFIGSHLARRLVDRGDDVRCLVRGTSDLALLEGIHIERVLGDITVPTTLPAAVEGSAVVFHLAGIRRSPSASDFERVNVVGTRNVLEAVGTMPNPARVVFASSLAAMGPSQKDRPHSEEDTRRPSEWYGESKSKAEEVCREFSDRVPVATMRPPRVIGPGDRENLFFFKIVKRGWRLVLGGGPRHLSMIDVDDLIDAVVLLGDHPAAVGEAFFAAADETITLEGILDFVAQSLCVDTRSVRVPEAALRALALFADGVSKLTGRHLPLNRKLARQLLAPGWTCSTRKIREVLGFVAKTSLKESIDRSTGWYVANGWL